MLLDYFGTVFASTKALLFFECPKYYLFKKNKFIFIGLVSVFMGIVWCEKAMAQTPTPIATFCCNTLWSYPEGNTTFSTDTNGLAYDPAGPGTLYVGGVSVIQSVNPTDGVTIGTLPGSYGGVNMMTCGQDGFLYVADNSNHAVFKVALPGGARAATFSFPSDTLDTVYADDQSVGEDIYVGGGSGNAYKVTQAGPVTAKLIFSPDAPTPARGPNWGLLLQEGTGGAPSTLYYSDPLNSRLLKFVQASAGSLTYGYVSTVTTGGFIYPHQMAKNGSGEIYLVGSGGYWAFDPNFLAVLANCSSLPSDYDAQAVALDSSGSVYVGSTQDNGGLVKLGCVVPTPSPTPTSIATSTPSPTSTSIPTATSSPTATQSPTPLPFNFGSNPPLEGQCFIYPSPVRGNQATLAYYMVGSGQMDLKILNENGELVMDITDRKAMGIQTTSFDMTRLPPGIYYYVVTLNYDSGNTERLKTQKFAVVR